MSEKYNRQNLNQTKKWVVKIGSALLTNDGAGLDEKAILQWVKQMAGLKQMGIELVLVSSGAVAEGMKRLGWSRRPNAVYKLQAAAAVGQMGLVQSYESAFKQYDLHTAQILLTQLQQGKAYGTLFIPDKEPLLARKQWLAAQLKAKGQVILDQGAVKVLKNKGSSLLSIGVLSIEGNFQRGDIVICMDENNNTIARGLVNYNSEESDLIKGKASKEIMGILGYCDESELIHRDNLVLCK